MDIHYRNYTMKNNSLYDYLITSGRIPQGNDIMNSSSKDPWDHSYCKYLRGPYSSNTRNGAIADYDSNFTPERANFSITPSNTTLVINRTISLFTNIDKQDLFQWKEELFQTS